jgi:hypothetical protein
MIRKFFKWFFVEDPIVKSLKNLNKELGLPEDFGILSTSEITYIGLTGKMPKNEGQVGSMSDKYQYDKMDRS